MKKYILTGLFFFTILIGLQAQVSGSRSFVETTEVVKPGVTDTANVSSLSIQQRKQSVSYFDGLGRPLQKVQVKAASNGKDIVTPIEYDNYGREVKKFLPYVDADALFGSLRDSAAPRQLYYYNAGNSVSDAPKDPYPFSQTFFEFTTFARPLEEGSNGLMWQPGKSHTLQLGALLNTSIDSVQKWTTTIIENSWGSYTAAGYFAAGELFKSITVNEHGKQTIEYKDREGKTILKKRQLTAAADNGTGSGYTGWICTYYIYDDANNLRCVVQPKGVELLVANSWDMTYSSSVIMNEQCFRYEYDNKSRMIMKKIPGSGPMYLVYDQRDRLVLTQDSNMRAVNKWLYTQYDALNRQVSTGIWVNSDGRAYHGVRADTSIAYPNLGGQTIEVLTKLFYDDYSWRSAEGNPLSNTRATTYDSYFLTPDDNNFPFPQDATVQGNQLRGLITGTKTKIIGTSNYLYSVRFYDTEGRLIQTQSTNITGGTDVQNSQYSWNDETLLSITKNEKAGTLTQTSVELMKFTYDDQWKVVKTESKIAHSRVNSGAMPGTWTTINEQKFGQLGQLRQKKLGSTAIDSLEYEYHIRGWLLGVNRNYAKDASNTSHWFGFDLGYDNTAIQPAGGSSLGSYTAAQFNGNITGTVWKSKGDNQIRKYDFTNDAVQRFTSADFNQYTSGSFNKSANVDFSVNGLVYDANGNIIGMNQKGWKLGGSETIDSLLYTYQANTNRLKNVLDRKNDTSTRLGDFRSSQAYMTELGNNKTTAASDYVFDGNGNIVSDENKDIASIVYNHLNLPDSIHISGKGTIKYVYDAGATKLKKIVRDSSASPVRTITTLYLRGNYVNDTLQYFSTDDGRARINADSSLVVYDYMFKDQVGNVRMILTEEKDTAFYPPASLETAQLSTERMLYSGVDTGRINKSAVSGYPTDTYTSPNNFIQKLRGDGPSVGSGIVLKVMAGDKFNVRASSWWKSADAPSTFSNPATSIVAALNEGVGGLPGSHITPAELGSSGVFTTGVTSFINSQDLAGENPFPKAYLSWILFDEQFNYVSNSSGFDQAAGNNVFKEHTRQNQTISKSGYLYVFVSNRTENVYVYFDNLQVTHIRGPLVSEEHYYPYGLTMVGISGKALGFGDPESKIAFNGSERQTKEFADASGIEWYDYKNRFYDNQLGRFFNQDKLADDYVHYSPYQFAGNEVPNAIDVDGLESERQNPLRANYKSYDSGLSYLQSRQAIAAQNQQAADTRLLEPTPKPAYIGPPSSLPKSTIAYMRANVVANQVRGSLGQGLKDLAKSVIVEPLENAAKVGYGLSHNDNEILADGMFGLGKNALVYAGGYVLGKTISVGITTESLAASRTGLGSLYHYTSKEAAPSITKSGLNLSKDGFVYTTTEGGLTPIQAQINLALSPNRGLPGAIIKIDAKGLSQAGINPILGPRPVTGGMSGAGGGTEVLFNKPIPPKFLTQIQ